MIAIYMLFHTVHNNIIRYNNIITNTNFTCEILTDRISSKRLEPLPPVVLVSTFTRKTCNRSLPDATPYEGSTGENDTEENPEAARGDWLEEREYSDATTGVLL